MSAITLPLWHGDYQYLVSNLVLKDFKVRYRNMSLGLAWSIANPLVMMGVLTFVFTVLVPNNIRYFPVYLLAGLVPFNFFSLAWSTGTASVIDNANLLKRLSFPREIIPISSVLANCVHYGIQLGILLAFTLAFGLGVHASWLYLPLIVVLQVVFLIGLTLISSAVNVYIRDTRYAVESAATILFWLVPVFYSWDVIPARYKDIYMVNPIAAVVMAFRNILIDHHAPAQSLLLKLTAVSLCTLGLGLLVFHHFKRRFYDYL